MAGYLEVQAGMKNLTEMNNTCICMFVGLFPHWASPFYANITYYQVEQNLFIVYKSMLNVYYQSVGV